MEPETFVTLRELATIILAMFTLAYMGIAVLVHMKFKTHWAIGSRADAKGDPCVAARVTAAYALFLLVEYVYVFTVALFLFGKIPALEPLAGEMFPDKTLGFSLLLAYSALLAALILTWQDLEDVKLDRFKLALNLPANTDPSRGM